MNPSTTEATAYHEAGHAVLALSLGRLVQYVSILPKREYLGSCTFGKAVFRPSEDWVEREILIALGGLAAEARFTGVYSWPSAQRDLLYVRRLTERRAGPRQAERLERRLLSKAEHLLAQDKTWLAVQTLAQALMKQGEISGRTARHLYEQCQDQDG